jgi:hypothetical protein
MEATSERDNTDRRTGPTVSKDKWLNHARNKLARGYVLIVGTQRKTANFYLKEKGYESCPYQVAREMVKVGMLEEAGEHYLGTLFRLRPDSAAEDRPPARRSIRDDDDMEPLVSEMSDGAADVDDDVEEEEEEERDDLLNRDGTEEEEEEEDLEEEDEDRY